MKSGQTMQKQDLLDWINEKAATEYKSIETLGDCIAYLNVLDVVHPRIVTFKKLRCRLG